MRILAQLRVYVLDAMFEFEHEEHGSCTDMFRAVLI